MPFKIMLYMWVAQQVYNIKQWFRDLWARTYHRKTYVSPQQKKAKICIIKWYKDMVQDSKDLATVTPHIQRLMSDKELVRSFQLLGGPVPALTDVLERLTEMRERSDAQLAKEDVAGLIGYIETVGSFCGLQPESFQPLHEEPPKTGWFTKKGSS